MNEQTEVQIYGEALQERIAAIAASLDGLTDEQVRRVPDLAEANSLCVIATHALECARSYVLDIACGLDVGRDRPAEFASKRSADELRALARTIGPEIKRALDEMDPARLDVRSVPAKEVWGTGEPREVSGRWALAHMVSHLSVHLGQMQIVRPIKQSSQRRGSVGWIVVRGYGDAAGFGWASVMVLPCVACGRLRW